MVIVWKDNNGECFAAQVGGNELRLIRILQDMNTYRLRIEIGNGKHIEQGKEVINGVTVGAFKSEEAAENALFEIARCAAHCDEALLQIGENGVAAIEHKQAQVWEGPRWMNCTQTRGGNFEY